MKLVSVEVRSADDLDAALDKLARERVQAVLISPDPMFTAERRRIATWAVTARLATMYSESYNVSDGGLISYGVNRRTFIERPPTWIRF
jgi:ABC-type uncharacterized transport system substrate-binding protein